MAVVGNKAGDRGSKNAEVAKDCTEVCKADAFVEGGGGTSACSMYMGGSAEVGVKESIDTGGMLSEISTSSTNCSTSSVCAILWWSQVEIIGFCLSTSLPNLFATELRTKRKSSRGYARTSPESIVRPPLAVQSTIAILS